jgi:Na+/glutamate symporter
VKLPIFSSDGEYVSLKRIAIFCIFYAVSLHIISIIQSMGNPDFSWERQFRYPSLVIFSFVMCLMITIITMPISSFITYKLKFNRDYDTLASIFIAATLNCIIYLFVDYFFWSSVDYPLDLHRALRIASPFYLAALACLIF